ncbi:hypothetical protein Q4603_12110 [Zobellia galactanivorans]|uniref:Hypothetical membrane protein n=1 Tax=Zobellia galactanivorans (strain DSM 12802 / CCUG 47099 / CIP 106680 / NCIMB 13871 / Dsij) TaxID=63186 RepID=G0L584_ZOBGA|nr:hypothetical protein [Zobellia galactanivorans]MBU3026492.1 hypothetical protein [Zobellia galactanivorans]MDO6809365.1 hypothetical protein [Zobellia galactanivorans]CAZ96012.1 Hypothetical membrane protein [Zobellia galactanivorans]
MQKKGHLLWNILGVLTVIVCLSVFVLHFKNWTKTDATGMRVISGFYLQKVPFSALDSVDLVEKIPPMVRLNGFSAFQKEKGVFREFKDSLTDKKVYVYIDNLENQKIKIVHHDSLKLFINLKDSTETQQLFDLLSSKLPVEPN